MSFFFFHSKLLPLFFRPSIPFFLHLLWILDCPSQKLTLVLLQKRPNRCKIPRFTFNFKIEFLETIVVNDYWVIRLWFLKKTVCIRLTKEKPHRILCINVWQGFSEWIHWRSKSIMRLVTQQKQEKHVSELQKPWVLPG